MTTEKTLAPFSFAYELLSSSLLSRYVLIKSASAHSDLVSLSKLSTLAL